MQESGDSRRRVRSTRSCLRAASASTCLRSCWPCARRPSATMKRAIASCAAAVEGRDVLLATLPFVAARSRAGSGRSPFRRSDAAIQRARARVVVIRARPSRARRAQPRHPSHFGQSTVRQALRPPGRTGARCCTRESPEIPTHHRREVRPRQSRGIPNPRPPWDQWGGPSSPCR